MRDGDRRAALGQQHEQAPGAHPAHREHAAGDGVEGTEVEQQPAVRAQRGERLAQRGEVQAVERGHQ